MTPQERAALDELGSLITSGRPVDAEIEKGIDWAEGIAEERAWERRGWCA